MRSPGGSYFECEDIATGPQIRPGLARPLHPPLVDPRRPPAVTPTHTVIPAKAGIQSPVGPLKGCLVAARPGMIVSYGAAVVACTQDQKR